MVSCYLHIVRLHTDYPFETCEQKHQAMFLLCITEDSQISQALKGSPGYHEEIHIFVKCIPHSSQWNVLSLLT